MPEDYAEYGPQLPMKKEAVVNVFNDPEVTEPERKKILSNFVSERQAESEFNPTRLTAAFFNLDMAKLYFELGMIEEARVSASDGYKLFESYLPPKGKENEIDDDVYSANKLYWAIMDAIPKMDPAALRDNPFYNSLLYTTLTELHFEAGEIDKAVETANIAYGKIREGLPKEGEVPPDLLALFYRVAAVEIGIKELVLSEEEPKS